jgi:hypothetical protein
VKFYFLIIEILLPFFGLYLVIKKKDLLVVFLPFLFFASETILRTFPYTIYYVYSLLFLLYLVFFNLPFLKRNIFSSVLVVYYFILLRYSRDFWEIKTGFFNAVSYFVLVPLVSEIYRKYEKSLIIKEISVSSLLILIVFITNAFFSTIFRYSPTGAGFYGATSGVWYGALSLDSLNLLPFAIYMVFKKGVKENNILYLVVYLAAEFLILLTFRRSVMVLSLIASLMVFVQFLSIKQIKTFFLYGSIVGIVSILVLSQTDFVRVFQERFEQRNLGNREIKNEGRILELGLVYKDLFVYYDYDPWFGYGLFDTHGNYGKRKFGDRSLHTDLASLVHSSGILGLILYSLMVFVAFRGAYLYCSSNEELLMVFFSLLCFAVFFINGRYYTISYTSMLMVFLWIPIARMGNDGGFVSKIHS